MRCTLSMAVLVLAATIAAGPITPAAFEYQRRAEQMRSEGMAENDIAKQLSLPILKQEVQPRPVRTNVVGKLHLLLVPSHKIELRDSSGDIAPGSLEGPEMLPRAAAPETPDFSDIVKSLLGGKSVEKYGYGYEGKETEMRRPKGMRHWG